MCGHLYKPTLCHKQFQLSWSGDVGSLGNSPLYYCFIDFSDNFLVAVVVGYTYRNAS